MLDGLSRDSWGIVDMKFPVFATGLSPADSKGRLEVVAIRSTIPVGGVSVAEGDLVIKATGLTITAAPGLPALISNATDATAINEKGGSGVTINGSVQALRGGAYMATTGDVISCGIYAATTITIISNSSTVNSCAMPTTTLRLSG